MNEDRFDVAVIGYGPTGLVLASLLGARGHKVVVIERWPSLYGLPRLTHIDGETARLLSFACNLDDALRDSTEIGSYEFCNGKGKVLFDVSAIPSTPMAHPAHISIHQPDIENALDARVRTHPTVTVRQGTELIDLEVQRDEVRLQVRGSESEQSLYARFVFGADGARSFVRQSLQIAREDFGFNERWLNVDGERKRRLPSTLKETKQYCDPARGHMFMPIGETRQRFEFALLAHEQTEAMEQPETAWKLLDEYHGVGPEDITIIRQIVYTFECRLAKTWRSGPVLLGGDAAHTMPPYLGQGACSGIRDAANIAWKLDLVLRGLAGEEVIDSYETERRPHVTHIMKAALDFGKVANTHSRLVAAIRDFAFRAKLVPAPPPFPPIGDGVVRKEQKGPAAKAVGAVPPQSFVEVDGKRGRLDEFTGYHFALIARTNPLGRLDPSQIAFLEELGCVVFTLADDASNDAVRLVDPEGNYGGYLAGLGKFAMLTRPDTNLFGFATGTDDVAPMVDDLRSLLFWKGSQRERRAA